VTDHSWRTIGQLAELVGDYCWVERRLFALTGEWASAPEGDAEIRLFFAAASRRHAELAERWCDRLPVRAGVERAALISPPSAPAAAALDRLQAEPGARGRLAGLVGVVLPRLVAAYGDHLSHASPVSEGPVLAVLGPARRTGSEEMESGLALLERVPGPGGSTGIDAERAAITADLERYFGDNTGVFPCVRPS
jgi:hypothetical protein